MKNLIHTLERLTHRAGIIGGSGIALVAMAFGYYIYVVEPLNSRADKLRAEAAIASTRADDNDSQRKTARTREERISAFHNYFPPSSEIPDWLEQLYKTADVVKLTLIRGEYRRIGEETERPRRIQVTLPVKGSYGQIRRFVATALTNIPFLSVDEVRLQRATANEEEIEAQIRFTLFVGDAP